MSLTFRPEVSSVLDLIQSCLEKDVDLYLVGGGIRDVLLGRKLQDLDFSMSSDPTSLARRVADRLKAGFFVLDDDRHTARVVYRTSDGGFFPLDFVQYTGESLTDDLYHRDFTINAMAISIRNRSEIIDPLDGQADLKVGRLDVCQPHALLDDPVRVLRGVRLAMQFDFSYAPGLEKLMREAALHLHKTSYERQRDEVFKILEGPHPAKGMQHFYQFGVFETLIPALMEQESIPASSPHVLPLFEHTLRVVEEYDQILKSLTSDDPQLISMNWWLSEVVCDLQLLAEELRTYFLEEITPGRTKRGLALLGALLHDIGKPMTMEVDEDGHLYYYSHAAVGADLAWEAAKRLKLSNAESEWIRTMVRYHMRLLPLIKDDKFPDRRWIYRFFRDTGEVGVPIAVLLLADTAATCCQTLTKSKWESAVRVSKVMLFAWWQQRDTVISPVPLLDGNDLQRHFGLKPGERIGTLLAALREAQASGEVMDKEDALNYIKKALPRIMQKD